MFNIGYRKYLTNKIKNKINVRETRKGSQEWVIQGQGKHWTHLQKNSNKGGIFFFFVISFFTYNTDNTEQLHKTKYTGKL